MWEEIPDSHHNQIVGWRVYSGLRLCVWLCMLHKHIVHKATLHVLHMMLVCESKLYCTKSFVSRCDRDTHVQALIILHWSNSVQRPVLLDMIENYTSYTYTEGYVLCPKCFYTWEVTNIESVLLTCAQALANLKGCKALVSLNLAGNPVCQMKGYTEEVTKLVPTLRVSLICILYIFGKIK
jgi:hypothetical protein